jgi:hypothetical protein
MKAFLIAALTVAVSSAAFAKDLKGSVMTDSEMDKVTAGDGFGLATAAANGGQALNGYDNGIFPHALGNARSPDTPGFGNCTATRCSCFTATTQVLMADGTTLPIAAVKIGDEVLGENGQINRVVDIETPVLGTRKLYALNDGPAFVTPEHPFLTHGGWKSIAPEATFAENNKLSVEALKVGDELVKLETITTRAKPMSVAFGGSEQARSIEVLVETKFSSLQAIVPQDGDPSMVVYNLRLDGNHTYFANNYLVHNK